MRASLAAAALLAGLAIAGAAGDPFELANRAYGEGDDETGNRLLVELIESRPGDVELAMRCLERIYTHSDRADPGSPWLRYVVQRVAALERAGHVPAGAPLVREILSTGLKVQITDRRLFEAAADYDDLAQRHPYDIYWRSSRARGHHALALPSTRDLFEELKQAADRDHPDPWIRERWENLADILDGDFRALPQPLLPPAEGSPLVDLQPDDPDGRWQHVAEQPMSRVAGHTDRLIGLSLLGESIVPWRDMSGLVDPPLALDLHLRSLPPESLAPLRIAQERSFGRESVAARPSHESVLRLFRRYPWAASSHQQLLRAANRELYAGHARSALRSFDDLLAHSADEDLLKLANKGRDLATGILAEAAPAAPAGVAPSLPGLPSKMVQIPPVSPWPGNGHPGGTALDLRILGDDLMVSSRNHLAIHRASNPSQVRWRQTRHSTADDRNKRNLLPGYFRPEIVGEQLFLRWGSGAVPSGIAAFDREHGRALWMHDDFGRTNPKGQPTMVPLGDPVESEGLLYVALWNTQGGAKLELACMEASGRRTIWRSTIVQAGLAADIVANLERSNDVARTFGNRVTVSGGAVYVNSNTGVIARCDARDGRVDWLHYYKTTPGPAAGTLGCAPIVQEDRVICMPRDSGRVFALDKVTGRLLWQNTLLVGVESLGLFDGTLIARGQTSLAALDLADGVARWNTPLPERLIGRTQRIGGSIYIADRNGISEIDASSGTPGPTRPWTEQEGTPLAFHVHSDSVYIVGDQPADDRGIAIAEALNPDAPAESTALGSELERRWSLWRSHATVFRAPQDSPLAGYAFVLSEGMLECIELTPRGSVKWRRFVNAPAPAFHIIDDRVLLIAGDKSNRHVTALRGRDGRPLWERSLPPFTAAFMRCGDVGLLYDQRARLVAFDAASGDHLWERRFGFGHLSIPRWNGETIDLFQTSMGAAARHIILDPRTGATRSMHEIELGRAKGKATDGQPVADGFYEVGFKPVQARYFRLVMLSEINGRGWSSVAELELAGAEGGNLDRSEWKAHFTDSFEPRSRYSTVPSNVFDGDRSSWWHSQWLGGIPPHPHELQIDLGAKTSFKALRYLPAVIVNNNGMIGDYELYASDDAKTWGEPIAAGTMVRRVQVDRAAFSNAGLVFEARKQNGGKRDIYSYLLDGKQAVPLAENHELITAKGPYVLAYTQLEGKRHMVVLRADDPAYRLDLGADINFDRERLHIEGDRLCLATHKVIIADLASRRLITPTNPGGGDINRHGMVVRLGANTLGKLIHAGNAGTHLNHIDLQSGAIRQSVLSAQIQPTRHLAGSSVGYPRFDGVLLLRDDTGISLWSSAR